MLRVFTNDFAVQDVVKFRQSTVKLFDYLMSRRSRMNGSESDHNDKNNNSNNNLASSTSSSFINTITGDGLFFDCLTKEEAVANSMIAAFASIPKTYSTPSSTSLLNSSNYNNGGGSDVLRKVGISKREDKRAHITVDQITPEGRRKYIERLEEDCVLGPLLLMVRSILFEGRNDEVK